jgi:hypothetical protein
MSIRSALHSIKTIGVRKAAKWGANAVVSALVGIDWYQGITAGAQLDAYYAGACGSWRAPSLELGLAGGAELVVGRHTGNLVAYAFGGGTTQASGAGGYVGFAFNVEHSGAYRGFSRSVTVTPSSLPARAKAWIGQQLTTFLPRLHTAFAARRCDLGALARSVDPALVARVSQTVVSALSWGIDQLGSVTLWGGAGEAIGFSISPGFASWGTSEFFASAVVRYVQISPLDQREVPF